jgi:glycosyltransferase involved in cell wall biosynthesis
MIKKRSEKKFAFVVPTLSEVSTLATAPKISGVERKQLPYARVAIITRTKDRPLTLRRAIRSVLDQTFKNWLLVIVNDGGNPEGVEVILDEVSEELAGQVLVLHHPVSLGMQTASNAGISSCDSDFIIIHDDDDTWEPSFLARTVSYLDEHGWNPKLGGIITWSRVIVEEFGEYGEVTMHNRFIFNDKLYNISLIDLAVENRFPPISFLFRRCALDAVGPFNEQYGPRGDWDFHLRVLGRFDIDVIPEPLANYHHRPKTASGVYGNSVYAQQDLHQATRGKLLNNTLREGLKNENGQLFAHLMALCDVQNTVLEKQDKEFQRLHNYIKTIEEKIKYVPAIHWYISSRYKAFTVPSHGLNLVSNGDFRLWPGPGKTKSVLRDKYTFQKICPGFVVCYDGRQVSYRVDRRKWTEDGQRLPFGKPYLHIENDGHTKGGTWFILECIIPSVLVLSGQNICVSGLGSLKGSQNWIFVGGRYNLGNGRELNWSDQMVSLSANFERWTCSITCPSIHEPEAKRGHNTRIFLKLPHDQPFEFDLTNFQVELGTTPTEFEYNGALTPRDRLFILRAKTKRFFKIRNSNQSKFTDLSIHQLLSENYVYPTGRMNNPSNKAPYHKMLDDEVQKNNKTPSTRL